VKRKIARSLAPAWNAVKLESPVCWLHVASCSTVPLRYHWLGVHLVGTKSNRDGIGARLKLVAGSLTSYDQAKGGMSYCSAQDPRIYFGLGSHARVDSLEILWPSGARDLLRDIPAGQIITVEEGKGITPYRFPNIHRPK
jgi:hypothetical protein